MAACAALFLLWVLFYGWIRPIYAWTRPKPKPEPPRPPKPPNPAWEGLKTAGLLLVSPIIMLLPVVWVVVMVAVVLLVIGGVAGLLLIGLRAL
jgi:hypothetical protein